MHYDGNAWQSTAAQFMDRSEKNRGRWKHPGSTIFSKGTPSMIYRLPMTPHLVLCLVCFNLCCCLFTLCFETGFLNEG